jgi:eukaryotic-like serine/threonine-protein kinase
MSKSASSDDSATRPAVLGKLGKYELVSELGRGAFGVVYKGLDPFVRRVVAIKVAAAGATENDESFFSEARAAGALNHPYIVTLYDAAKEEGQRYLVMEFVEGDTLQRYCDAGGDRLPVPKVVDVALKCALALDYMHKSGVLHKDIKPRNIALNADGAPKIMDFGIAAMGAAVAAGHGRNVYGSPMFMSPEQLRGKPLTPAADLYSLGAVIYLLLMGRPMFEIADQKKLFLDIKTRPAPSLVGIPGIPTSLAQIVDRLLAKEAGARFQSGRELADALSGVADELRTGGARRKKLALTQDSLKQLRFFKAFRSGELGELMDASTTATYKAGQEIVHEGDMDSSLYILVMGLAEVRKGKQLVAMLEKGDCFGEIGFLYAVKRTASVIATTDVMVLKVNAALLEQMSEKCQLHYYKVFCENLILRLTLTTEKATAMLPKSELALDFILP